MDLVKFIPENTRLLIGNSVIRIRHHYFKSDDLISFHSWNELKAIFSRSSSRFVDMCIFCDAKNSIHAGCFMQINCMPYIMKFTIDKDEFVKFVDYCKRDNIQLQWQKLGF